MGRPPIGTRAMTNAEHQARHRARHGKWADPGNAARQQRWRERQADKRAAEQAAREASPEPPDPLLPQAVAILEERGDTELLRRLPLHWPHMDAATRRLLVEGKASFRVYLREG